jgi:hypothetical protein
MDGMTMPLVAELSGEVSDPLDRVAQQITSPSVQPTGLLRTGSATLTVATTIGAKDG